MLEFQYSLDIKYNPYLIHIEHDIKFGKNYWAWDVLQEELVDQIKNLIYDQIEITSVVPSLKREQKEKENLKKNQKWFNSSKAIGSIKQTDMAMRFINMEQRKNVAKPKPLKIKYKSGTLSQIPKNQLVRNSIKQVRQKNYIDAISSVAFGEENNTKVQIKVFEALLSELGQKMFKQEDIGEGESDEEENKDFYDTNPQ